MLQAACSGRNMCQGIAVCWVQQVFDRWVTLEDEAWLGGAIKELCPTNSVPDLAEQVSMMLTAPATPPGPYRHHQLCSICEESWQRTLTVPLPATACSAAQHGSSNPSTCGWAATASQSRHPPLLVSTLPSVMSARSAAVHAFSCLATGQGAAALCGLPEQGDHGHQQDRRGHCRPPPLFRCLDALHPITHAQAHQPRPTAQLRQNVHTTSQAGQWQHCLPRRSLAACLQSLAWASAGLGI